MLISLEASSARNGLAAASAEGNGSGFRKESKAKACGRQKEFSGKRSHEFAFAPAVAKLYFGTSRLSITASQIAADEIDVSETEDRKARSPVSKQTLRLYTDRLAAKALTTPLCPTKRVIYIAQGTAVIRGGGVAASLAENCAWQGDSGVTVSAGAAGARLLRWEMSSTDLELAGGPGVASALTLEAEPLIEPGTEYLMRCDRVDFPPGGLAYTHTHKGSGIRCLQSGRIRIETQGHEFWVEPDGAWFESGRDPVFAETWQNGASHFVRVMILPRAIQGKSSITYVKPEDLDKPKLQKYQVFVDEPIALTDRD